jgi:hypothetical protein
MIIKTALLIIFPLVSLLTFDLPAYSIPTKWEDAKISMTDLLNSGWRLTAHGTNRVAANSNAGNGFDQESLTFVLSKNDKYIVCFLENPKPPVANIAGCRKLN